MSEARVQIGHVGRRRWPRYVGIALVVLAVLLSVGLWLMNYVGLRVVAEQHRYHAVICVCELVATHVERSAGKEWPRSWEELEKLPARDFNTFAWPRDEELLQALVIIDFSATVESAVRQTPDTFDSVRPAGEYGAVSLVPIYDAFLRRIGRAESR